MNSAYLTLFRKPYITIVPRTRGHSHQLAALKMCPLSAPSPLTATFWQTGTCLKCKLWVQTLEPEHPSRWPWSSLYSSIYKMGTEGRSHLKWLSLGIHFQGHSVVNIQAIWTHTCIAIDGGFYKPCHVFLKRCFHEMHFYSLHFIQVRWNSSYNTQFLKSWSIIINSWETLCTQIPASLQITEPAGSFFQEVGTIVLLSEHRGDCGLTDVRRAERWVLPTRCCMRHLWNDLGKADSELLSLQTSKYKIIAFLVSPWDVFWLNGHRSLDPNCITRKVGESVPM